MMKKVDKKEFENFVNKYPNKVIIDEYLDIVTWYDCSLSEHSDECKIAQKVYNCSGKITYFIRKEGE